MTNANSNSDFNLIDSSNSALVRNSSPLALIFVDALSNGIDIVPAYNATDARLFADAKAEIEVSKMASADVISLAFIHSVCKAQAGMTQTHSQLKSQLIPIAHNRLTRMVKTETDKELSLDDAETELQSAKSARDAVRADKQSTELAIEVADNAVTSRLELRDKAMRALETAQRNTRLAQQGLDHIKSS